MPPTSSKREWTCLPCNGCSVTAACRPPPTTCTSARTAWRDSPALTTCWPPPTSRAPMPPPSATTPPPTLAELVRTCGQLFQKRHPWLTDEQRKALRDVARCRTKAMGGRMWSCSACGYRHTVYRSCRNRHCPGCQGADRAAWLDRELSTLLPVEYYAHQNAMVSSSS